MNAIGLVGVEGGDDVRVRHLGDRLDLPLEAEDGGPFLRQGGGQDLQGDDPLHAEVHGLVDVPHAAPADLVEDDVGAQDQPGGVALEEGLGMEGGELSESDHLVGEFPHILGRSAVREVVLEGPEVVGRDDAAVGQVMGESSDILHGRLPAQSDRNPSVHGIVRSEVGDAGRRDTRRIAVLGLTRSGPAGDRSRARMTASSAASDPPGAGGTTARQLRPRPTWAILRPSPGQVFTRNNKTKLFSCLLLLTPWEGALTRGDGPAAGRASIRPRHESAADWT